MSFLLVSAPQCVLSGGFRHRTWMALALERPDCSGSSGFTWSFGGFSTALGVWRENLPTWSGVEGTSWPSVSLHYDNSARKKGNLCDIKPEAFLSSLIICGKSILSKREVELLLEKLGKATFNYVFIDNVCAPLCRKCFYRCRLAFYFGTGERRSTVHTVLLPVALYRVTFIFWIDIFGGTAR